ADAVPGAAIPLGDVHRRLAPGEVEYAADEQGRPAAIVIDRRDERGRPLRRDGLQPDAQRQPLLTGPPGDAVGGHAAGLEEVAAGVERCAPAIVEGAQRCDSPDDARAQGPPPLAV